jgi:hypothetical protein
MELEMTEKNTSETIMALAAAHAEASREAARKADEEHRRAYFPENIKSTETIKKDSYVFTMNEGIRKEKFIASRSYKNGVVKNTLKGVRKFDSSGRKIGEWGTCA